jgi:hypothetical protein
MNELTIRTSKSGWLKELATAYKNKTQVLLIDDANVGVDPAQDSIFAMGRKAGLNREEWMGVLVCLGVAATGAFVIVMAVIDPEPFSKLGFTLAAGAVMTLGGGLMAVKVLTRHRPPSVRLTKAGFEIKWED